MLAPQNTIEAVRAALAVGVDLVEFDVAPGLVVAHDPFAPGAALADFLDQLSECLPEEVGLMVDLKGAGYELAVVRACERAGLLDRCLFATLEQTSIPILADHARTSFSYSRRRPGPALGVMRNRAPALHAMSGAVDATIRHPLITERLVDRVHEHGGRVFAWTVNDTAGIRRMQALGVDGIITDDPRLLNKERPCA